MRACKQSLFFNRLLHYLALSINIDRIISLPIEKMFPYKHYKPYKLMQDIIYVHK